MQRALPELRRDFRRRQVGDLNAGEAGNGAAIVASAARLHEFEPGAREERLGVLLQAAFRGNGEDEGRAHGVLPSPSAHAASSSIEAAKPTAAIGSEAPSRVSKPS